jgi:antitoxin ParD1/3/4
MEAVMNVSLTPELEKKIEARVASGNYTSASELVREALRLFFEIEESRHDEIAAMNRRIAQGIAEFDRGEGIAGDEARRRSLKRLTTRTGGRRRGAP